MKAQKQFFLSEAIFGDLDDKESSNNTSNGSNGSDEITSADFTSNNQNSSLDIAQLVVTFNTAVTQNGLSSGTAIDFTGAGITSSQIIGAIESSLENANSGSGNGLLSGAAAKVSPGDANETKLLLFTDGGSGSAEDVAMVYYNEGGLVEQSYSGELTLTHVIKSIDISTLTHDNFWG